MGQLEYLAKTATAGRLSVLRNSDQERAPRPHSDGTGMPLEDSSSLAATLGSIMLSLSIDGNRTPRLGA